MYVGYVEGLKCNSQFHESNLAFGTERNVLTHLSIEAKEDRNVSQLKHRVARLNG
jgi:hypothetical protein